MRKVLFLFVVLLFVNHCVYSQQNVYHRSDAGTDNWWDGANPWYYQTWNNYQDRPDRDWRTANDVFFGHNSNKNMVVNGANDQWYYIRSLTFQIAANEIRTLTGTDDGAGIDLRGTGTRKIENLSSAEHILDVRIAFYDGLVQFNPVSGNLDFRKIIYNNGYFIDVYGNNENILSIKGDVIGTGGIAVKENSTVLIIGDKSYTGSTIVEAGILELQGSIANSDVTVQNGATLKINGTDITVASLNVESGGVVNIEAGKSLTVTGNVVNDATTGIVLISPADDGAPGSLKIGGTYSGSGSVSVQRYIAGFTSSTNGWHLLSLPFDGFDVTGTDYEPLTTEGDIGDLYYWKESESTAGMWMNWKASIFNLTAGTGYLAAYEVGETKSISGTPYNSDVILTNLSYINPDPTYSNTWHLLGNPFPCALEWDNSNGWSLANIGGVAKIMNVNDGSYSDLASGGTIPAMQGFFVSVENATNSIKIPLDARIHSTQSWHKSTETFVKLNAVDLDRELAQESNILFNENGNEIFDFNVDSRFLGLYAPSFYSVKSEQALSTNCLPTIDDELNIPMGFKTNGSQNFQINLVESTIDYPVYLTDNLLGVTQKLSENPNYTFTSQEGDDPNRFEIHFGVVGIDDQPTTPAIQAYVYGQQLKILGNGGITQLEIFDVQGRLLSSETINVMDGYRKTLNLQAGMYVVRLQNKEGVSSTKVIIK